MSFRFRKRIRIMPGVYMNLSKGGISTSVGVPGATVNFSKRNGVRGTVGLPGTGLSYSERIVPPQSRQVKRKPPQVETSPNETAQPLHMGNWRLANALLIGTVVILGLLFLESFL